MSTISISSVSCMIQFWIAQHNNHQSLLDVLLLCVAGVSLHSTPDRDCLRHHLSSSTDTIDTQSTTPPTHQSTPPPSTNHQQGGGGSVLPITSNTRPLYPLRYFSHFICLSHQVFMIGIAFHIGKYMRINLSPCWNKIRGEMNKKTCACRIIVACYMLSVCYTLTDSIVVFMNDAHR